MTIRFNGIAVIAASLFASSAFAQTNFPELEPNSVKTEATAAAGLVAGDTISGFSTGTTATAGLTTDVTVDLFRVRTASLPLGIYKHTLTLTTVGQTTALGHTGTIRGLTQTTGVINTVDAVFQTSTPGTGTPLRANHWFGFGNQEEIYYRVQGTTATTNAYTATLSTATVTPVIVPGTFAAGPITLTTIGQTTADTEIFVYDGSMNAIAGFHNDDDGPAGVGGLQSELTRTFRAGTYFVAVSDFNSANNLSDGNPDEDTLSSAVLDFPNALASGDRETGPVDYDFTISDGGPVVPVTLAGNGEYDVAWATFTVVGSLPPPADDACASATVITSGANGHLGSATNDGLSGCDAGGASSRDVWYAYTVPVSAVSGGIFSANTCGSTFDTALSVYSSCGGAELVCNDDCGGSPCGATRSCVSLATLVASQTVIIRVSDKGLGGGYFSLNVSFVANPPANDDCNTPIVLPGPGTYPFDNTIATTGTQGQGTTVACTTTSSVKKDLWYTYTSTISGSVTIATCNLITSTGNDSKISYYAGAGCPVPASPLGCDDDACTTPALASSLVINGVTCGQVFTIQLGSFSSANIIGSFSVTETGTSCIGVILAGSDIFVSPAGSSNADFVNTPIPAGFFDPGSDPFTGNVMLAGAPLAGTGLAAGADTVVRRNASAALPACPSTDTIPIEMIALSLMSTTPITVTFNGGTSTSQYNVLVALSSNAIQQQGNMTIRRDRIDGGTLDSILPVTPRLVFTKVAGALGTPTATMDPAPTIPLQVLNAPWSQDDGGVGVPSSPGGLVDHDGNGGTPMIPYPATTNFYPGILKQGGDCLTPAVSARRVIVPHMAPNHAHGTTPPAQPPASQCAVFCLGDGSGVPCPCGNHSILGDLKGCLNSLNIGGRLRCNGNAIVAGDTFQLLGTNLLNGPGLYIQSNGIVANGVILGDGKLCAAITIIRLGVVFAANNASVYPSGALPPVSVGGFCNPGDLKHYQLWYRDSALFCTPATNNLTNGVSVTWQ